MRNGDFWVIRLDADGNVLAEKAYGMNELGLPGGNENIEMIPHLSIAHDGGYILAGSSYPLPVGTGMLWVLKLAEDLSITWQYLYSTEGDWHVLFIQVAIDGGYILSGFNQQVIKLDSLGKVEWGRKYGGGDSDRIFNILQAKDGGYIGVGTMGSLSFFAEDLWVFKVDTNGDIPDCSTVQPVTATKNDGPPEVPKDVTSTGDATMSDEEQGPDTVSVPPPSQQMVGDGCINNWDLVNLQRTGQSDSSLTGDDGEIQAGQARPVPRFVDNDDGTVRDTLTGLVWLQDANCSLSIGYSTDGRMDWGAALDFVADINSGLVDISGCGYMGEAGGDWRLANINELDSLVHDGVNNKAAWLGSQGFEHVMDTYYYWSSTPAAGYIYQGYALAFGSGYFDAWPKSSELFAWPVRSGQQGFPDPDYPANLIRTGRLTSAHAGDDGSTRTGVAWPSNRFMGHGDGPVTDTLTGLMWLQDSECLGEQNWPDALDSLAEFNITPGTFQCTSYTANHIDWRLPNRKELNSLLDRETNPALPPDSIFLGSFTGYQWTSTLKLEGNGNSAYVWAFSVSAGVMQQLSKSIWTAKTWAVRGGIHDIAIHDGDVNGDGEVNLEDAIVALQIVAGQEPDNVFIQADVDYHSTIGLSEAVMILRELGE